jgi:predicted DNA-binding protein
MAIASVAQSHAQKQDACREVGMMKTRTGYVSPYDIDRNCILQFAREVVRDHAEEMEDGYYLRVKDLPNAEKQILLSYSVECIELYEDFIQNPTRLQAAYEEYEKEMQYWIDEVIDDEYQDMYCARMEENDMVCRHHADNGEPYWVRRY